MKRVFIIHGWDGYPEEGIFPWLKRELQAKGVEVQNPAMPDPVIPRIGVWPRFLKKQVGEPDENTFLVGHSMGAQTILRYLESLKEGQKIGGVVLLAGFVHLGGEAYESEDDPEVAKPWLETPLDWKKIKSHANKFVAVFSDNDPFVPLSDSEIFRKELGAEIHVVSGWEHFSGSEGITKLPVVLQKLLAMMK